MYISLSYFSKSQEYLAFTISLISLGLIIPNSVTKPVRSVSFTVGKGERVAIVGESGCGKSLTALSLTRLPPTDRAEVSGEIFFEGKKISSLKDFEGIRGNDIAYVFQDPSK